MKNQKSASDIVISDILPSIVRELDLHGLKLTAKQEGAIITFLVDQVAIAQVVSDEASQ